MKSKMILTTVVALLLPAILLAAPQDRQQGLPAAGPQPDKTAKGSQAVPKKLEEMLQQALRTNPQVIEAKGKLQQAMVELNRVKLEVTRSVVHAHFEMVKLKQQLALSSDSYKRIKARVDSGVASSSEIRQATLDLVTIESTLEQMKADIAFLLGAATAGSPEAPAGLPGARSPPVGLPGGTGAPVKPPTPTGVRRPGGTPVQSKERQKMRQVLQKRVSLSAPGRKLDQVLLDLMTQSSTGLKIVYHRELEAENIKGISVQLNLGKLTLQSALQAIADNYPIAFVFRSYGLLVTTAYNSQFFADSLIIR